MEGGLRLAVLGVAVLVAASAGALAGEDEGADRQTPRFPSKAALVRVDVVALDEQGYPVTDLRAQDFGLEEDGVPRSIETLQAVSAASSAASSAPSAPASGQRLWTNDREARGGRTAFLVFDDLALTPVEADEARKAAKALLQRLQPGDTLGIATASGKIFCTGRTSDDREGLLAALLRLSGGRSPQALVADQMSDYEASRIVQHNDTFLLERVEQRMLRARGASQSFQSDLTGGAGAITGPTSGLAATGRGPVANLDGSNLRASVGTGSSEKHLAQSLAQQVQSRASERRGRLLQALARAIGALQGMEGRKSVVVLSARYLEDPSDKRYDDVRDLARRAMVVLYAIDVAGLRGGSIEAGADGGGDSRTALEEQTAVRAALTDLASEGGGIAITNSNDLPAGLERIARDSSHYYLLGFRPASAVADGKYRPISVVARRPGVRVLARPGYFATGDEETSAIGDRGDASETLRRALDSPFAFAAIPMRLAAYSFERTKTGGTRTQVVTELGVGNLSFEPKDGQFAAEIEVMMGGLNYATGRVFGGKPLPARITTGEDLRGRNAWYRLAEEIELPPGETQVRFVVRDRKSGKVGSVIASLLPPSEDGSWRTSSLVLSDAVASEGEGKPQHALPQARRTFPAGGLLHGEFEVYGGSADKSGVPRVSTGFALVRKGGAVEREGALEPLEPNPARRFARLVSVPLGRLNAGEYEFVLKLRDDVSGQMRELREPLTLVRPARITPALYDELVQDYVAGRAAEALGELFAWRASDIAEVVRELPASDPARVHAAAMLHTEAVLTLREQHQPARAQEQLAIARALLARAEPRSGFRRDWLLAVGALIQGSHSDEEALPVYDECLQAFPSAAPAWLASGTLYERGAFPDGLKGGGLPGPSADLAKEAERRYRQALVLDPTLAEAHLRLGRILARTGRTNLALPELTRATDENADPGVKALAHLFLGDLSERAGRNDEALAHYRVALKQDPTLQPAALAQASLLERREGRAAAVSALESVLRGGCTLGPPRWLGYHMGLGVRATAMLDELRRLVHS